MEGDRLGENMLVAAFAIRGDVKKETAKVMIDLIMDKIDVLPAHTSITYDYPVGPDKGGVGYTYIQPITESFIAFDAWPDKGGAYFIICSCKPFWLADVIKLIEKFKFQIIDTKVNGLSIIKEMP
jgi:S-adenosylmethionine/arginine decarboxylase-like enzyme